MHSSKQTNRRKLTHALSSSGSVLLFLLIIVAFSFSQLAILQPLTPPPSDPAPMEMESAAPLLDSPPTIYLPIVAKNPQLETTGGCNASQGTGGLPPGIHETTVAGFKAVVVVGDGYNPQKPSYLAFYLHGDEGNYTQFKYTSNKITKFIKQRGWVFVAPQSPNNGDSWWDKWQGDHVEAMAKVLKAMFDKYNLCRKTIFGSSISGGSIFWTKNFFPNKGDIYPAYAVLVCGGLWPIKADRPKVTALGQKPDIVKRSTFEFVYGTEDHLYKNIQDVMTLYKEAGFKVTKEELAGVGHCVPDFASRIVTHWTNRAAILGIN